MKTYRGLGAVFVGAAACLMVTGCVAGTSASPSTAAQTTAAPGQTTAALGQTTAAPAPTASASAPAAISGLAEAPSAADALPAGLPANATDGFETGSIRFAGSSSGLQLWLAAGTDTAVCVMAYESVEKWVSTCGNLPTSATFLGRRIAVTEDGAPTPTGYTRVGANIAITG